MQKICGALLRLEQQTGRKFFKVMIYNDGSGQLLDERRDRVDECKFDAGASPSEIAAAIDKYRESLKPKPRPIPEIVKDLKAFFRDIDICDELEKLLDELSNSTDATFPF